MTISTSKDDPLYPSSGDAQMKLQESLVLYDKNPFFVCGLADGDGWEIYGRVYEKAKDKPKTIHVKFNEDESLDVSNFSSSIGLVNFSDKHWYQNFFSLNRRPVKYYRQGLNARNTDLRVGCKERKGSRGSKEKYGIPSLGPSFSYVVGDISNAYHQTSYDMGYKDFERLVAKENSQAGYAITPHIGIVFLNPDGGVLMDGPLNTVGFFSKRRGCFSFSDDVNNPEDKRFLLDELRSKGFNFTCTNGE